MIKILYVANARIPSERAHSLQIAQSCEALMSCGAEVVLVLPGRKILSEREELSVRAYYGLQTDIKIIKVGVIDTLRAFSISGRILTNIGYWLLLWSFVFSAYKSIKKNKDRKNQILYTRDPLIVLFLGKLVKKSFYEAHDFPETKIGKLIRRWIIKKSSGLIVINSLLKGMYVNGLQIDESKVHVAPDGFDPIKFKVRKKIDKEALALPTDKKIAIYAGGLLEWKGVYTLVKASSQLIADQIVVMIGSDSHGSELKKLKKYARECGGRVLFLGQKPHYEIPEYLNAADLLVLPTSGRQMIGRNYTSPLKLFEYMAAKKPIIAADLPSSREILSDNSAIFFEADNHIDLANAMKKIFADTSHANKIALAAHTKSINYSWENRSHSIKNFIKRSP